MPHESLDYILADNFVEVDQSQCSTIRGYWICEVWQRHEICEARAEWMHHEWADVFDGPRFLCSECYCDASGTGPAKIKPIRRRLPA